MHILLESVASNDSSLDIIHSGVSRLKRFLSRYNKRPPYLENPVEVGCSTFVGWKLSFPDLHMLNKCWSCVTLQVGIYPNSSSPPSENSWINCFATLFLLLVYNIIWMVFSGFVSLLRVRNVLTLTIKFVSVGSRSAKRPAWYGF